MIGLLYICFVIAVILVELTKKQADKNYDRQKSVKESNLTYYDYNGVHRLTTNKHRIYTDDFFIIDLDTDTIIQDNTQQYEKRLNKSLLSSHVKGKIKVVNVQWEKRTVYGGVCTLPKYHNKIWIEKDTGKPYILTSELRDHRMVKLKYYLKQIPIIPMPKQPIVLLLSEPALKPYVDYSTEQILSDAEFGEWDLSSKNTSYRSIYVDAKQENNDD